MDTVLSLSQAPRKAGPLNEKPEPPGVGYSAIPGGKNSGSKPKKKSQKRHSVPISTNTCEQLVVPMAKKINPGSPGTSSALLDNNSPVKQPNKKNLCKSQANLRCKEPKPTGSGHKKQASGPSLCSPGGVKVRASKGELMRCLGEFLCRRCHRLKELSPGEPIKWLHDVDRWLLLQGWQDKSFVTSANLVFVYLICRETIGDELASKYELQASFLTCLYMAYSYIGSNTSYPLKPFRIEMDRNAIWHRCLTIINQMSDKMLQINSDPQYYTQVLQDLKNEGKQC